MRAFIIIHIKLLFTITDIIIIIVVVVVIVVVT